MYNIRKKDSLNKINAIYWYGEMKKCKHTKIIREFLIAMSLTIKSTFHKYVFKVLFKMSQSEGSKEHPNLIFSVFTADTCQQDMLMFVYHF